MQIYSKSSWNSIGWRIGKDLCLNASTSQPYNRCIHNAILFLPYPPSHASFNRCFPFCTLSVARSTFQSSSISRTNKCFTILSHFQDWSHTIRFTKYPLKIRKIFNIIPQERERTLTEPVGRWIKCEREWILRLKSDMWNMWYIEHFVQKCAQIKNIFQWKLIILLISFF